MDPRIFLEDLKPGSKSSEYHALAALFSAYVAVGMGQINIPWEVLANLNWLVGFYLALRVGAKILKTWREGKLKEAGVEASETNGKETTNVA